MLPADSAASASTMLHQIPMWAFAMIIVTALNLGVLFGVLYIGKKAFRVGRDIGRKEGHREGYKDGMNHYAQNLGPNHLDDNSESVSRSEPTGKITPKKT